ncbi:ribonuclease H-like domain-containing protein [Niallia sp. XMNu-256]|uniref:ribonuclease H-like domain-containing protein n=1 Tax=Niallia sp. XMNu-256 TaxID=3082444 RepID=UPI0030D26A82
MSIKNKLNRLKNHLSHNNERGDEIRSHQAAKQKDIPFLDIWEEWGVTPYFVDEDYCLVREVTYPLEAYHGKYRFIDFLQAVHAWNHSELAHPLSSFGYKAQDLFFFDTETTGLGAGTGTTIFLLGHASVKDEEIVVKQHILPQPGSEVPLYKSFLESINYTSMVTYNGKAFDWPQVQTQHTLIRNHVPKLPAFGHFDLYHAARRMWKHRLDRIKLFNVEREILGFERKDDIPGFLAPMIYFDFVERKNPEGMLGILKHNELDILSLITLYTHLTFQLLNLDKSQTSKEFFEVGRWFSYIGEKRAAEKVYTRLAESKEEVSVKAKHELAFVFKKKKEWGRAIDLWTDVVKEADHKLQIEACVELAKIFEHRLRDLDKAIEYTEIAMKKYFQLTNEQNEKLLKRMTRLTSKILRK